MVFWWSHFLALFSFPSLVVHIILCVWFDLQIAAISAIVPCNFFVSNNNPSSLCVLCIESALFSAYHFRNYLWLPKEARFHILSPLLAWYTSSICMSAICTFRFTVQIKGVVGMDISLYICTAIIWMNNFLNRSRLCHHGNKCEVFPCEYYCLLIVNRHPCLNKWFFNKYDRHWEMGKIYSL